VRTLVEERIVACGNILPGVDSIYRWQGAVSEEPEVLIVFKTSAAAWPRLQERLPELHPYDTPELLLVSVADGLAPYLQWVTESTEAGHE
jgi:periplasmic divalent cation tolerance protein